MESIFAYILKILVSYEVFLRDHILSNQTQVFDVVEPDGGVFITDCSHYITRGFNLISTGTCKYLVCVRQ